MTVANNFDEAVNLILKWEGYISDHPSDPGGLTKWGISLRFLKMIGFDVTGDSRIDKADIRALTIEQVKSLYKTYFWNFCDCDKMPYPIALCVFDCAVNQGPGRSIKFLQKAIDTKADGDFGPKSRQALAKSDINTTIYRFMARRAMHYTSLPSLLVFGLGWFRRLSDITLKAGIAIGKS